jgi:hypothetical protein
MHARLFALALSLALPVPAVADTALVIANARYENAQNLRGTRAISGVEDDLDAAGFDVILVENGDAEELRAGLSELLDANETERVVIVATGHFAHGAGDTWLAGSDARAPDLAQISAAGLPLSILEAVAARAPGRAMLLLATEDRQIILGAGLATGLGPIDPAQGVTVVAGSARDLSAFLRGPLLTPGTDLAAMLDRAPSLDVAGFVSSALPFLNASPEISPPPPLPGTPVPAPVPGADELALWQAAEELNTPAAYGAYLQRYPQGAFADLARARATRSSPPPKTWRRPRKTP